MTLYTVEHIVRMERRLEQLEAQVQAVRELHRPTTDEEAVATGDEWCVECVKGWDDDDWDLVKWPCTTIRTLGEE